MARPLSLSEAASKDHAQRLRALRYLLEVLNNIFDAVEDELRPGITPAALGAFMEELAHGAGVRSSARNYRGFRAPAAISVNGTFLNGVPGLEPIAEGNVVHIQFGVTDGMAYAHQAWAYSLGPASADWERVLSAAVRGLNGAAAVACPGGTVGSISAAIQAAADEGACRPNRDYVGCGIWFAPFGWPPIPCWSDPTRARLKLPARQAILVQSIMHSGEAEARVLPDGWGVYSADGQPAVALSQMLYLDGGTGKLLTPIRPTRINNVRIREDVRQ